MFRIIKVLEERAFPNLFTAVADIRSSKAIAANLFHIVLAMLAAIRTQLAVLYRATVTVFFSA